MVDGLKNSKHFKTGKLTGKFEDIKQVYADCLTVKVANLNHMI